MDNFKDWLAKSNMVRKGNEYAHCRVCSVDIIAHKNDIKRHSTSLRHKANYHKIVNNKKITDIEINPLSESTRRAELKLCGLLATNNLPFVVMDILSSLCSDLLPDSKIARNVSVRRTKALNAIRNKFTKMYLEFMS